MGLGLSARALYPAFQVTLRSSGQPSICIDSTCSTGGLLPSTRVPSDFEQNSPFPDETATLELPVCLQEDKHTSMMRLNYYPAVPEGEERLALNEHTGSNLQICE